jgi:DNA repair protein RadC
MKPPIQATPKIRPDSEAPPARSSSIPNFTICEATGRYVARRPLTDEQIIKAAKTLLERRLFRERSQLTSAAAAADFFIAHFAGYEREAFACLLLDSQNRPVGFEELFQGTINCSAVYPREIVKAALRHNAAAVILAHNHPSGCMKPSSDDQHVTNRIVTALSLVDVRVLDHFIVGGGRAYSFAAHGLLGRATQ